MPSKGYSTIEVAKDFNKKDINGRKVLMDEGAYKFDNRNKYVPPRWMQKLVEKHSE
jgi:hypothetical protein